MRPFLLYIALELAHIFQVRPLHAHHIYTEDMH